MATTPELEFMFNPENIAIVGVSDEPIGMASFFLKELIEKKFKGGLYPIHRTKPEIRGLKCYKNVKDIPGPLDYVIVSIPARHVPQLIKDCVEKKVKVCILFTAGFSEVGTEEGKRLEKEIVEIARSGGVRLVGPNCMGIYCPTTGLALATDLTSRSGNLGIICQSGGNAIYLCQVAPIRGAAISKAVSYGNGCDVNESDLLDYFAEDPETKVIAAYIEGIKDGGKFFAALKRAAAVKPTILLKGGRTEVGAATASSHTGALSGSMRAWNAAVKQAGAMQVDDMEELLDLAVTFLYMSPPKGRRVCIFGAGGGLSVMASDAFYNAGLSLPSLPQEIKRKLQDLTGNMGNIFNNPVDTTAVFSGGDTLEKTMHILNGWNGVDMFVFQLGYDILTARPKSLMNEMVAHMMNSSKELKKPMVLALHNAFSPKAYQAFVQDQEMCWQAGIPSFRSLDRTARALDRFIEYHEKRV